MDAHRIGQERSLEYHREVARRIAGQPRLVDDALALARRWIAQGSSAAPYLQRWLSLLAGPRDRLITTMTGDDEPSRELRANSPFAGALPPRERWRLWREVRRRIECQIHGDVDGGVDDCADGRVPSRLPEAR